MRHYWKKSHWLAAAITLPATLPAGCFARAFGQLDLLLSPGALDNAYALPQSAVFPLVAFLLQLTNP